MSRIGQSTCLHTNGGGKGWGRGGEGAFTKESYPAGLDKMKTKLGYFEEEEKKRRGRKGKRRSPEKRKRGRIGQRR